MASPARRPRRRAALAAVAVAALAAALGAGCSDDGGSSGDAVATTTTSRPATTTTTTAPDGVVVELLDAGATPRRPVRLAFEEGQVTTVVHRSSLSVAAVAGDRRQRLDPPAVRQEVRYEVTATDGATATVEARIEAVAADDEDLQRALTPMVGLEATFVVDDRGRTSDLAYEVPDDASDAVAEQLAALGRQAGGLGALLPAEPIGEGARWRTTAEQELGGATTTTTTTFTATEVGPRALRYETELEVVTVGDGIVASTLRGTGSGTTALDRLATSWEQAISGEQTVEVDGPDGTTTVTQQVELRSSALASGPL